MRCATIAAVNDKAPAVAGIALRYPRVLRWDDWWIPEGTAAEAMLVQVTLASAGLHKD